MGVLLDADLTVRRGAGAARIRASGGPVQVRFDGWRGLALLVALARERATRRAAEAAARRLTDAGIRHEVRVLGVPVRRG